MQNRMLLLRQSKNRAAFFLSPKLIALISIFFFFTSSLTQALAQDHLTQAQIRRVRVTHPSQNAVSSAIAAAGNSQTNSGNLTSEQFLSRGRSLERSAPISTLPDRPHLGIFQSQPALQSSSFQQASSSQVHFNYDVRLPNSFAALSIQFDNLGTPAVETADLTGLNQISFVLASNNVCPGNSPCLRMELEDITGAKAIVPIFDAPASGRLINIPKSSILQNFPSFRLQQVRFINFVLDQNNTQPATRLGSMDLTIGGLFFIPTVVPDPAQQAGDISRLEGIRQLAAFHSDVPNNPVGFASLDQSSSSVFNLRYDLNAAKSFAGSLSSFDDFGTAAVETKDLRNQTLVLGLKDPGQVGKVFVQLEDNQKRKSEVILTGVDGTERFFSIPTSLFDSVDLANLTSVGIVVKEDSLGGLTLSQIEAAFRTFPEYQNRGGRNAELIRELYESILLRQPDPGGLATWTAALAKGISLADIAKTFQATAEYQRLIAQPKDQLVTLLYHKYLGREPDPAGLAFFIQSLKDGSSIPQIVAEIKSSSEYINGNYGRRDAIATTYRNLFGREPDEGGLQSWLATLRRTASTLQVRFGKQPFTPVLNADPTKTAKDVSSLDGIRQLVAFNSQSPQPIASAELDQLSLSRFNIHYDVSQPKSFAGSITSFDDFGTDPIETQNLKGQTIVLGLRDSSRTVGTVFLQLEDSQKRKVEVALSGVDSTERFYSISTQSFERDIDVANIISLVLVVKQENLGGLSLDQIKQGFRNSAEYLARGGPAAEIITQFYLDNLQRVPDPGGLAAWLAQLRKGISASAIAQAFRNSAEFRGLINQILPAGLRKVLGRNPTSAELNFWTQKLIGGQVSWTELPNELIQFAALKGISRSDLDRFRGDLVNDLFKKYLGRQTDPSGLAFFTGLLAGGARVADIIQGIKSSSEYLNQDFGRRQAIQEDYQTLLGREPDSGGMNYWLSQLRKSASTLEVRFGNHPFTPIVQPTEEPVSNLEDFRPSPGRLEPCSVNQNPCPNDADTLRTVFNLIQDDPDHFHFEYDLSNGVSGKNDFRRFAGVFMTFPDAPLLNLGNQDLVIGIGAGSESVVTAKLEIEDKNGRKVSLRVPKLAASVKNFKITKDLLLSAGIKDFNPSEIKVLSIVVDEQTAGSKTATGKINVFLRGLEFIPTIFPNP